MVLNVVTVELTLDPNTELYQKDQQFTYIDAVDHNICYRGLTVPNGPLSCLLPPNQEQFSDPGTEEFITSAVLA